MFALEEIGARLGESRGEQAAKGAFDAALATYRQALHGAEAGLPADSPAIRALAIGGNNLAAALEEKTDRTPAQTAGMVDAARAALAPAGRALR